MKTKRLLALLLTLTILTATALSAAAAGCPVSVDYNLGSGGVSADLTSESVPQDTKPSRVPKVTALDRRTFLGWSLTDPSTLKAGEIAPLVEPTAERVTKDTTFYAVYAPYHEHYIIGYPNGNFGPGDNINRAAVATIIARAILPDFVEGYDYGNPGGYSDVSTHWAASAIAYCSKFGVFEGYDDGTFKPNRPITRQEFSLVVARIGGLKSSVGEIPFTDIETAGSWALAGIYTAYANGWVNGYLDGTFKPLNNISRAEAVKVFNAYLGRSVDQDGLRDLHEYAYPDENNGGALDRYRVWPDVPATYWAYYEIIEASNDHAMEFTGRDKQELPEYWHSCWID